MKFRGAGLSFGERPRDASVPAMAVAQPRLNQVAFSVVDLRLAERWFREGLGFLPAGGARIMASTPLAGRVQGIPRSASTIWWLVGRDPGFQLELFQFRRPIAKLMPADFRTCDIGYTRMGVTVDDFDATLRRLAVLGTQPEAPAFGERGCRRVSVKSPDGVCVEIMEDDPFPVATGTPHGGCPVAVRSVTVSTPDLRASVEYFTQLCGKGPEAVELHAPDHEALWGLAGAQCKRAIFKAGSVLLEVTEYSSPRGKPWPAGYRICDQGILNIAFGTEGKRDFSDVYRRVVDFGATANCEPMHFPFKPRAGVVYVNDKLGFSAELVWMAAGDKREWGWEPLPAAQRPDPDNELVSCGLRIEAPVEKVWSVLTDQDRMSNWIGFDKIEVVRDGFGSRNGVGSERSMTGASGTVVEQTVRIAPQSRIHYRVVRGSPFIYHQGEVRVEPAGGHTRVTWSIRFRSRIPLLGGLLRVVLRRMLARMLSKGLKDYVERTERVAPDTP